MGFFSRQPPRPAAGPARPDHCQVTIDGAAVRVVLNWSARASRYTLRVAGSVREPVMTIPARGSLAEAKRFLERIAAGSRRGSTRCPRRSRSPMAAACRCAAFRTRSAMSAAAVSSMSRAREATMGDAPRAGRRRSSPAPRDRLLKREARADFEAATARHAAALGVRVKAIRLGDRRAAGAPARRAARFPIPGAWSWRRLRCSTISSRMKSRICAR